MQYAEIEPFGLDADDFRAMVLASTIAAAAGAKDFDPSAASLRKFIESETAPTSVDDESRLDALLGVH
jgi:hypothetical protein